MSAPCRGAEKPANEPSSTWGVVLPKVLSQCGSPRLQREDPQHHEEANKKAVGCCVHLQGKRGRPESSDVGEELSEPCSGWQAEAGPTLADYPQARPT